MSRGMGKKELMAKMSAKSELSIKDCTKAYDALISTLIEAVCDCDGSTFFEEGFGPKVLLAGLGSVQLKKHKGHPVGFTGTPDAYIDEYPVLKFEVSPELSKTIRKLPKFKSNIRGAVKAK